MKKLVLSVVAISLIAVCSNAQIATRWRVNKASNYDPSQSLYGENFGGSANYPIFSEIDEAINWGGGANGNVKNDDTLYIEGNSGVYNSCTISKRLVLIGTGFFLGSNPNVTYSSLETKLANVEVNSGGSGSQFFGLSIGFNNSNYNLGLNTGCSNITVRRCYFVTSIYFGSDIQNTNISQNYFASAGYALGQANSNNVGPTNLRFNNNIVLGFLGNINGATFTECNNNLFQGPNGTVGQPVISVSAFEFRNNMILNPSAIISVSSPNLSNTIVANANQLTNTTGRVLAQNVNALFITGNTSSDGKYQLSANSQALNAGFGGTAPNNHIGPFGNYRLPYALSGVGPVPVIYGITSQGIATPNSGLPVTISTRVVK